LQKPLITSDLAVGYNRRNKRNTLHSHVDICLNAGEFVCLLGPNGAGKSTLLKTIAGFIPKISGKIMIYGKDCYSMSERLRSMYVSVVLTERPLIADMTVFELVALGRSPFTGFFGRINSDDRKMIQKSICEVGLKGFESKYVVQLSDGERQKAFIAKSLVQETPLILLDEPTAFLDLPSRVEIMHLLKDLAHNRNKSILLSTHDLDMALQTADRIWLMAANMPIETGVPDKLIADGAFKKFFEREGIVFNNLTRQFSVNK
jgi:iron complex transport system ATP-binding protein